jgi:hypothetical protein
MRGKTVVPCAPDRQHSRASAKGNCVWTAASLCRAHGTIRICAVGGFSCAHCVGALLMWWPDQLLQPRRAGQRYPGQGGTGHPPWCCRAEAVHHTSKQLQALRSGTWQSGPFSWRPDLEGQGSRCWACGMHAACLASRVRFTTQLFPELKVVCRHLAYASTPFCALRLAQSISCVDSCLHPSASCTDLFCLWSYF